MNEADAGVALTHAESDVTEGAEVTVPPEMYIVVAIIIILAALAAAGAWLRGGGLKREDAESLFSDVQEKQREDIQNLRRMIEESKANHNESLARIQGDISKRISELESVMASAAREHGESLTSEMESVSEQIAKSESSTFEKIDSLNEAFDSIRSQVEKNGDRVTLALEEMVKQQRDQKAQNAIQVCEALITSLGSLKNSIANQMDTQNVKAVESDDLDVAGSPAQWTLGGGDAATDENEMISDAVKNEGAEHPVSGWNEFNGTSDLVKKAAEEYDGPEDADDNDNADEDKA